MDVLQDEFQAARRKIYLTPMVAPAAGGPESGFFLPPVHDGQDKIRVPMSLSPQEMASQIERFRTLLREKEGELLKLRHEKILLKQIERRQQKDIESFETQIDEAPRIIRSLQEEIGRSRQRIKKYYAQNSEDSRKMRNLDEECQKLKAQNEKLEALNAEKSLLERSVLMKKLEDAVKKADESDKKFDEMNKKYETSEKNLATDNRQLRGKIHAMEREILLLRDRTVELDDVIREKDKNLASMSIYRYNAIHRKVESICKTCMKREKAESEFKRKMAILEKLPTAASPVMTVTSSTSVSVNVTIPSKKPKSGNAVEYSRLTLIYSDDPTMQQNTRKVLIDIESPEPVSTPTRRTTITRSTSIMEREHTPERPARMESFHDENSTGATTTTTSLLAAVEEKLLHRKVKVTNLDFGKYYFFQVVAGFQDVDGTPSKVESVFVDGLPFAPDQPKVLVDLLPPLMTIQFGPADCTGSAIQSYRLYHSTDASMKESFLAGEIKVADVASKPDSEKYKFILDNPELRVSHFFKITAVNAMGESPGSDTTEKATIDFVPRQPSKPIVKKMSSTSVQVSSKVIPNGGSEIDKFRILLSKVASEGESVTQEVPVYEFYRGELEYTLSSLEPDTMYELCVIASNCMGASEPSEKSDPVNLDALVPLAEPPQLEALPGGTCVKITLPDISAISKPVIKDFRINWSEDKPDFNSPLTATMRLDAAEKTTVVDHLRAGGLFFFAVSLIGEHEEGMFSSPVSVHLATALPLPDSPPETPTVSRAEQNALPPLAQSSSYRSQLSIDQKLQNMHDGMPALFDPVLGHVSSENLTGTGFKSKLNQATSAMGDESGKRVTLPRDVKSKSHSSLHRSDSNGINRESSIPRRKSTIRSQRKVSDSSVSGSGGVTSATAQASRSHAALTKNTSGSSDGNGAFQPGGQPGNQPNQPSPFISSQIPPRGAGQPHVTSSHPTMPRHASGPGSSQKKGPPRPKLL